MNTKIIVISLLSFLFIACGATLKLSPLPNAVTANKNAKYFLKPVKAADTRMGEEGVSFYNVTMLDRLRKNNMYAQTMQNADYVLVLTITKFQKREGASKYLFGAMAGSDGMETTVQVRDAKSDKLLGHGTIGQSDSSILASMNSMVEDSADQVIDYLRGKK